MRSLPEIVKANKECPDCCEAKRHAYSDATTPGLFKPYCSKHVPKDVLPCFDQIEDDFYAFVPVPNAQEQIAAERHAEMMAALKEIIGLLKGVQRGQSVSGGHF